MGNAPKPLDLFSRIEKLARLGYWVLDLETMSTNWSPGVFAIYGLDPGQPSPDGEKYYELVHSDDHEHVSIQLQRCLAEGHCEFDQRIIQPNGAVRHVRAAQASMPISDYPPLEGARVLLVEDNPINIKVASKFLRKWHVDLCTASNGEQAIRKVSEIDFDLVLMDLQMPEVDGLEATRRIRDLPDPRKAEIPIIALTASALIETQKEVIEAGMNDYVTKPFSPADLYRKVAAHVKVVPL